MGKTKGEATRSKSRPASSGKRRQNKKKEMKRKRSPNAALMEYEAIPCEYGRDERGMTAEVTDAEIKAMVDACTIAGPFQDPDDYVEVVDADELNALKLQDEELLEMGVLDYRKKEYFRPGWEVRFCISFDDNVSIQSSVLKFTSGFTWICVDGKNSKCAVTWSGDMPTDTVCRCQLTDDIVLYMALVDMKEMAKSHRGPCAVVSVANENHNLLGILKALEILEGKLKGRSSFSDKEVVEIAVDALKELYGGRVENREIMAVSTGISGFGQILYSMGLKP